MLEGTSEQEKASLCHWVNHAECTCRIAYAYQKKNNNKINKNTESPQKEKKDAAEGRHDRPKRGEEGKRLFVSPYKQKPGRLQRKYWKE